MTLHALDHFKGTDSGGAPCTVTYQKLHNMKRWKENTQNTHKLKGLHKSKTRKKHMGRQGNGKEEIQHKQQRATELQSREGTQNETLKLSKEKGGVMVCANIM